MKNNQHNLVFSFLPNHLSIYAPCMLKASKTTSCVEIPTLQESPILKEITAAPFKFPYVWDSMLATLYALRTLPSFK